MDKAELLAKQHTLSGVSSKAIWLTDRPKQESGLANSSIFIANWPMGDNSFEVDPPNAVLMDETADGEDVEIAMAQLEPGWDDKTPVMPVKTLCNPMHVQSRHSCKLAIPEGLEPSTC